ncbi:FecR family protein [Desertivirga xinjiangensis]|uniref:FecR family protein n=1 Tax=Desertivirga xinjiangensis TaxID=539206 RepID=UPI00210D0525|nr:FecR family protein [Pedobacter xinjiangensis]
MDELKKKFFFEILEKFQNGKASLEEIRFLNAYYESFGLKDSFSSKLSVEQHRLIKNEIYGELTKKIYEGAEPNISSAPRRYPLWPQVGIAACVIFLIGAMFFYYGYKPTAKKQLYVQDDVQPGNNKAILTLANGKRIFLSTGKGIMDAASRKLAEESGVIITRGENNQLIYTLSGQAGIDKTAAFNTIETPRGGQYQVILPDGTKIWLNSGSSARFPVVFSTAKREVEVTGETYFEVAKDANRPFSVISNNQVIEVLGTHFNVNDYQDDGLTRTTLVEGSVRIQAGKSEKVLKPGQQSIVSPALSVIRTKEIENIDEVLAWKDGFFIFDDTPLTTVIKQLERWYDIEFKEVSDQPLMMFNAKISRSSSLSKVLKVMEITSGIKFKIKGRGVYMEK